MTAHVRALEGAIELKDDGGTPDVITDFDAVTGITTGLAGAPQQDNDFVNLSSFYNAATLAAWNAANPGQVFDNALDLLRFDQQDGVLDQAGGQRLADGLEAQAVLGLGAGGQANGKGHRGQGAGEGFHGGFPWVGGWEGGREISCRW
mgnify:CR=1 FL=1